MLPVFLAPRTTAVVPASRIDSFGLSIRLTLFLSVLYSLIEAHFSPPVSKSLWYSNQDSNPEPAGYKPDALTVELLELVAVLSRQSQVFPCRLSQERSKPDRAFARWCRWPDSNRHDFRLRILSPLRLPVPSQRLRSVKEGQPDLQT